MRELERWLRDNHWFILSGGAGLATGYRWFMTISPAGRAWKFYGTDVEVCGWLAEAESAPAPLEA